MPRWSIWDCGGRSFISVHFKEETHLSSESGVFLFEQHQQASRSGDSTGSDHFSEFTSPSPHSSLEAGSTCLAPSWYPPFISVVVDDDHHGACFLYVLVACSSSWSCVLCSMVPHQHSCRCWWRQWSYAVCSFDSLLRDYWPPVNGLCHIRHKSRDLEHGRWRRGGGGHGSSSSRITKFRRLLLPTHVCTFLSWCSMTSRQHSIWCSPWSVVTFVFSSWWWCLSIMLLASTVLVPVLVLLVILLWCFWCCVIMMLLVVLLVNSLLLCVALILVVCSPWSWCNVVFVTTVTLQLL